MCLSVWLSLSLFSAVCLSVCLLVSLSLCQYASLCFCVNTPLSVSMSLSVSLLVCLSMSVIMPLSLSVFHSLSVSMPCCVSVSHLSLIVLTVRGMQCDMHIVSPSNSFISLLHLYSFLQLGGASCSIRPFQWILQRRSVAVAFILVAPHRCLLCIHIIFRAGFKGQRLLYFYSR